MKVIESTLQLRYRFLPICIMFFAFLASCDHGVSKATPKEVDHSTMEPMTQDTINHLLKQITQYGDTSAYIRVSGEFLYFHRETELLYYSLIMANKYNYGFAAAIVANRFLSISQESIEELDPKTRKLVLYYALMAFELGYEIDLNKECRSAIDTLQKSSLYLNL
jgi:hypothetical protein